MVWMLRLSIAWNTIWPRSLIEVKMRFSHFLTPTTSTCHFHTRANPFQPQKSVTCRQSCQFVTDFGDWKGVAHVCKWRVEVTSVLNRGLLVKMIIFNFQQNRCQNFIIIAWSRKMVRRRNVKLKSTVWQTSSGPTFFQASQLERDTFSLGCIAVETWGIDLKKLT